MRLIVTVTGTDAIALKARKRIEAAQAGLKFGASEGAFIIEQGAKERVPVDTGYLRDSINTVHAVNEAQKQIFEVAPGVAAGNPYGFDPAYARRIEFGFMGTDSLGRTYHQPAQPYMRTAYESLKDEVASAIKNGVIETLLGAGR